MQQVEKLSLIHEIFEKNIACAEGSLLEEELRAATLEDFYKNKEVIEKSKYV